MGREIKFRAWDIDEKKYHYEICIKPLGEIIALEIYDGEMLPIRTRCLVEQYTGIKDKNGVEIYEGDIVKSDGRTYEVDWLEKDGGWFCFTEDDYYTPLYHMWCEVIGNIHERPELLGGKE